MLPFGRLQPYSLILNQVAMSECSSLFANSASDKEKSFLTLAVVVVKNYLPMRFLGMGRVRLGFVGLGWAGLGWAGLGWAWHDLPS